MEEGINAKTNNKMLKFIVKPKASVFLRYAALKKKSVMLLGRPTVWQI